MTFSRRDFVKTSVLGAVAAGVGANSAIPEVLAESGEPGHASSADAPKRPILISANNGHAYVEAAYGFLKGGGDTLDAAIRVVKGPEDDPNDDSVGLGGLPNEECVVELDACCMHGPTRRLPAQGRRLRPRRAAVHRHPAQPLRRRPPALCLGAVLPQVSRGDAPPVP